MSLPVYLVGSVEFLKVEVTSTETLNTQPVSIHFDGTEYPAEWVGDVGTTRLARTTNVVTIDQEPGVYSLVAEWHDASETPLIRGGYVSVQSP